MWTPIVCPRVVLRELDDRDLVAFAEYRSDPEVARYQGWAPPFTLDDARGLLASVRAAPFDTPGTWAQIAIADRTSDALLGDLGVHFLADRQVELGFTLARGSQGRGLAQEALIAMLDHLFTAAGKLGAIAWIDGENTAAARLLGRVGFHAEATLGNERQFACRASEWRRPDPRR